MKLIFESTRLGFRAFKKSEALALYQHHSEKDYKRWFPNESYGDIKEARAAIDFFRGRVKKKRMPYVLAIELPETGELIGDVGVNEFWDKSGRVEIGYSICEKYQGAGYAAEAVMAMTEFVMSAFSIKHLYGRVMQGNEASCRVLQKSGYTYQGIEMGAADDPYGNGMMIYLHNECEDPPCTTPTTKPSSPRRAG